MPDDTPGSCPPTIAVPGWTVTHDDGLFTAVRDAGISDYQHSNGVLREVSARIPAELLALTSAQTRLYQTVRSAEYLARAALCADAAEAGLAGDPVVMVVLDLEQPDGGNAGES